MVELKHGDVVKWGDSLYLMLQASDSGKGFVPVCLLGETITRPIGTVYNEQFYKKLDNATVVVNLYNVLVKVGEHLKNKE